MDSRFDSVAAVPTSDRGCRKESGSSRGFTGALARLARALLSSVGVASESSRAEPDQACPKYSKMLLSDALEGRRVGKLCRMAAAPSDGTDTLGRSTLRPPVSGSLDLAFCPAAVAPLALERCCHDCVLSELAVRASGCSMLPRYALYPCAAGWKWTRLAESWHNGRLATVLSRLVHSFGAQQKMRLERSRNRETTIHNTVRHSAQLGSMAGSHDLNGQACICCAVSSSRRPLSGCSEATRAPRVAHHIGTKPAQSDLSLGFGHSQVLGCTSSCLQACCNGYRMR
jgi:hypothetical protein